MAERYAIKTGDWSALDTWDGEASLPGVSDDVHANTFTVTIDQDVTVLSVRTTAGTTAAAGGGFTLNDGITLTANIIAGSTNCVTYNGTSGNSANIVGNATGSLTTGSRSAILSTDTGTLNVTGNSSGGSQTSSFGINNSGAGHINLIGNSTGGSGTFAHGMQLNGGILHTVIGDSIGGEGSIAHGIGLNPSTTLTLTGNIISSILNHGVNLGNVSSILLHNGNSVSASNGRLAVGGTGIYLVTNDNIILLRENNAGSAGDEIEFTSGGGSCDYPAESDVRDGVSFNNGGSTGTLEVGGSSSCSGLKRSGFTW